jgi:capsular exopolysaccharide synthesis family protein
MELIQVTRTLLRWWWVIAFGALLGGIGAFAINRQIDPTYRATASFVVTVRSGDVRPDEQRLIAGTYLQLVYQRPVLETVADRLQLNMSVDDLEDNIEASFVEEDTLLLRVTVEDTDPQRASAIANDVIAVLADQGRTFLNSDQLASRALLQVVEIALPPDRPIAPSRTRNLLLGLIIGTMFAGGGVVLKEVLDTVVRSEDRVRQVTGLNTLVAIPKMSALPFTALMPTRAEPTSSIAETYRLLRARINFAATEKPVRTLVITSSMSQEGTSTILANLAADFAQSGKQVLLVDTNLRQPALHKFFSCNHKVPGLAAALAHDADDNDDSWIANYVVATNVENVQLMPAGSVSSNPTDLLGSARMTALCNKLAAYADIVLFDSPAILSAVDAMLLAQMADATLLVVHGESTYANELEQATAQLSSFGVSPLGVVLNVVADDVASFRKEHYRKPKADGIGLWSQLQNKLLRGRKQSDQQQKAPAIQQQKQVAPEPVYKSE